MIPLFQAVAEHAAATVAPAAVGGAMDTPTIASALTLLTVTIKSVLDHRKGKAGATHNTTILKEIRADVKAQSEKLDAFTDEQRTTNHSFDKRISEVSAHVIGPDGENGLRSRVKALEDIAAVRPENVGALRPPRRA